MPATLRTSALNTPDTEAFEGGLVPGAVAADAPVFRADGQAGWLLQEAGRSAFTAVVFGDGGTADRAAMAAAEAGAAAGVPVTTVRVPIDEAHALATRRYDARDGTVYLLRPDQHVCARWRRADAGIVRAALDRALCCNA